MKMEIGFIIAVTLGVLALICSISYIEYTALKSMERNIDSAIVKGIDPVAVKCAYKPEPTMCTVYAVKAK